MVVHPPESLTASCGEIGLGKGSRESPPGYRQSGCIGELLRNSTRPGITGPRCTGRFESRVDVEVLQIPPIILINSTLVQPTRTAPDRCPSLGSLCELRSGRGSDSRQPEPLHRPTHTTRIEPITSRYQNIRCTAAETAAASAAHWRAMPTYLRARPPTHF